MAVQCAPVSPSGDSALGRVPRPAGGGGQQADQCQPGATTPTDPEVRSHFPTHRHPPSARSGCTHRRGSRTAQGRDRSLRAHRPRPRAVREPPRFRVMLRARRKHPRAPVPDSGFCNGRDAPGGPGSPADVVSRVFLRTGVTDPRATYRMGCRARRLSLPTPTPVPPRGGVREAFAFGHDLIRDARSSTLRRRRRYQAARGDVLRRVLLSALIPVRLRRGRVHLRAPPPGGQAYLPGPDRRRMDHASVTMTLSTPRPLPAPRPPPRSPPSSHPAARRTPRAQAGGPPGAQRARQRSRFGPPGPSS